MSRNAVGLGESLYTNIAALRVHYKLFEGGRKDWILILHGWNQLGLESWLPLAKQLAKDYNIIALDLPAFGKSGDPVTVWDTQRYSDFVLEFIDFLATKYKIDHFKLNIVSHSFGGSIACLVGGQIQLQNLILIAPAIYRARPGLAKQIVINFSQLVSSLLAPLQGFKIYRGGQKIWRKLVGGSDYSQTSGIKSEILKTVVLDHIDQQTLAKIKSHTLLVWGQRDLYTPFKYAKLVQSQIPNSDLLSYPNINHGVHIHNQIQLCKDICDFIQ
jgi:pimeloyl-ACP methyl ester carboxylesterase